jgi:NADP-dependent aldehyde dehydrogenase
MLNRNIAQSMSNSLKKRAEDSQIVLLTGGDSKQNVLAPNNTLLQTSGKHFMQSPALLEEIFGPVSLVVVCESKGELLDVANYMEGNLTATIHAEDYGDGTAAELLEILSWKAGRVLFNGYPTGVEVCPSMNHGGAYPASSMPATTSVGSRAITRFARRAAYQNCPDNLLPPALQDLNPLNIWREIDGSFTRSPVTPKS